MRASSLRLWLAAVVLASAAAHGQVLRIEGPSVGQALAAAAVTDHRRAKQEDLKVSYGVSGTGAAFSKFCRNEIDAVVATRPIVASEQERCRFAEVTFIEMPVAFDAIVVVTNPRNSFLTSLSLESLRTLWSASSQDTLIRWDQLDSKLPRLPIKLYGPVAQSEGASYFNEAVLGGEQAGRRDVTESVDDSILIRAIARDVDGLSYVSLSTYLENRNKLKAVAIVEGAGAVLPSGETVAQGRYRMLSRPLFVYVRAKVLEQAAVKEFAGHWIQNGARIAQEAKLVPLSGATYTAGAERLRRLATGSLWEGKIAVGVTLQEIERRQTAL